MSDVPDKKELLNKLLKFEGFLFIAGGLFFAAKPEFTDWVAVDTQTDTYIGYSLILVGFVNILIAKKFFNNKT